MSLHRVSFFLEKYLYEVLPTIHIFHYFDDFHQNLRFKLQKKLNIFCMMY